MLLRLTSDLGELLGQAADGALEDRPTVGADAAVLVVAAAEGYPTDPRTGDPIDGLAAAAAIEHVEVLCAGVAAIGGGRS